MFQFATKSPPQIDKFQTAWLSGYHATEIWLDVAWLEKVDDILRAGRTTGLNFVPHFPNSGEIEEFHLQEFMRLYRELDCRASVIHRPMLDAYGERLVEISDGNWIAAVENGNYRVEQFWHWAESNTFLNFDVEHLWKFTLQDCPFEELLENMDKFLDQYGSKLRHVHMPGYLPGEDTHRPAYLSPDFSRAIWDRLKQMNYSGFAVSELSCEYQFEPHLKRDLSLFNDWAGTGGTSVGMSRGLVKEVAVG